MFTLSSDNMDKDYQSQKYEIASIEILQIKILEVEEVLCEEVNGGVIISLFFDDVENISWKKKSMSQKRLKNIEQLKVQI